MSGVGRSQASEYIPHVREILLLPEATHKLAARAEAAKLLNTTTAHGLRQHLAACLDPRCPAEGDRIAGSELQDQA
ncbi:hypothetical protein EV130_111208 [Rhizobium azibense]|uniref:Uncharacterized protein n=1 Tax=Rhizobium azibense TaxID=1136135 RepID=A0A4R3QIF2_9HYPH|nr:hypothetical protein EV130_111208 [Rhizobium azibense]TCU32658.1 hypothetical protein EV129_119105 [Rhizobium azibense]